MSRALRTADLADRYRRHREDADAWFAARAAELPLPPYASADLRDAGFKVASVDLNLFPAGHNNLHPRFFAAAVDAWRTQLRAAYPAATSLCIIPESHTRNTHYLQNVTNLSRLLTDAGYDVSVATVDPKFRNPVTELEAADGAPCILYKAERRDGTLIVDGRAPDIILLNNDLADGAPEALLGLSQPVLPPIGLGWHARRKSEHFAHYARLAAEWAALLDVDPWIVTPQTALVTDVDFHEPDTLGPLGDAVGEVIEATRAKYAEFGVEADPYCFIKDDAGTYGMGVLIVRSADEAASLNRKQRNKMDRGKANAIISRVIVQEGIPTTTAIDGAQAEPVLYAVGDRVIGGFRRFHPGRQAGESLNAKGAKFADLGPQNGDAPLEADPVLAVYAAIARIAILAAGCEIRDRAVA